MMKWGILLFFILFNISVFGQDKAKLLDSVFTSLHQKGKFNGNVLIAEKGEKVFEKSYGLADEKTKRPLNTMSIFELASVSKQFTAMGIVLLHKQGKLNYDDNISRYIPELAFYGNITIRNLLNHTSGLPDYMELFEEHWDKKKFVVNSDIVIELAKHKPALKFQPNQKHEYSNTGYALLGYIIEKVSKESFGNFLQANIFKPLGMEHTLVYRSRYQPQAVENYALGYVLDRSGKKVLLDSYGKTHYTYYLDGIVGDGMVNSTTEDLLKWDRALYSDKLVQEEDKKLIFNGIVTEDGKNTRYGFGWVIKDSTKYGKIVSHSGGWAGYVTFIERHINNDKTIIILQNNRTPKTNIPGEEVRKILYGEPLEHENLKVIQPTKEQLGQYVGIYAAPGFPMKLKVFFKRNVLHAQAIGKKQDAFPLEAYENHIFKSEESEIKMTFDIEKHTIDFRQGKGLKLLFTRE